MVQRLTPWAMVFASIVMVVGALVFWNQGSQTSAWIYPYFSGAANLGLDFAWKIDAAAYPGFAQLPYAGQLGYEFVRGHPADLTPYSILDRGYVFIIWFAQKLFFWLPAIKAVLWFQVAFHILSVLWVLGLLPTTRQRVIFFLAYAINPLVLHFVTFAYIYYWQVIPALAWFWYEHRKGDRSARELYLLALVLMTAFLIRQSTLFVSFLLLAYAAWRHRRVVGWGAVVCFMAFVVMAKNPAQPWHTAYVGVGAYPNDAGIELSDDSAYKMFKDTSGIQINTIPPNGNYYDAVVREQYYAVLKKRFLDYAKGHPLQLVRNAVLNVLQGFSAGYPVGHSTLIYASSFGGFVILALLAARRMYVCIGLIFAGVAGFAAYYPPIPAYMFGNYLLLAVALSAALDQLAGMASSILERMKSSLARSR